jgi:fructokinase
MAESIKGSNKQTPVVVGLGELLWDCLPEGKQLGGAPANFAYHAQAQGARGEVVSCVGEDELGREATAELRRRDLGVTGLARDSLHPTGSVSVELDREGKPKYLIHEDVAWDHMPFSHSVHSLALRADAVCFGTLAQRNDTSRATIRQFLAATRPSCLRVFDINLRGNYYSPEVLAEGLRSADVLKLSDEEAPLFKEALALTGELTGEDFIRENSLKALVLTRGGAGSIIRFENGLVENLGIAPECVSDTVGAGDAFTAAVAVGMLRQDNPGDISDRANRLASYVCSQPGAMTEVPDELGQ